MLSVPCRPYLLCTQFTQLGSPRDIVVKNAIKDLTYHCEMLDRMGLDQDSVMIIHGGGTFGDKPGTLERLRKNYVEMVPDNVKGRLVLENDEICYNVDDILPICEELGIPLVLGKFLFVNCDQVHQLTCQMSR